MSDAPIILVPLDRPKLRAGYEQDWQDAMALKAKISSVRETVLLHDKRMARIQAYCSIATIIFLSFCLYILAQI